MVSATGNQERRDVIEYLFKNREMASVQKISEGTGIPLSSTYYVIKKIPDNLLLVKGEEVRGRRNSVRDVRLYQIAGDLRSAIAYGRKKSGFDVLDVLGVQGYGKK